MKRACYNCDNSIPPETEHFIINNEVYCADCVEEKPYTAYTYYVDDEYAGCSEDGSTRVESYEDEYEEDEAS